MSSPILHDIKQQLQPLLGQSVFLQMNCGRNRIIENEGILESLYPNIFTVRVKDKHTEHCISYSYTDILTRTVKISHNSDIL